MTIVWTAAHRGPPAEVEIVLMIIISEHHCRLVVICREGSGFKMNRVLDGPFGVDHGDAEIQASLR